MIALNKKNDEIYDNISELKLFKRFFSNIWDKHFIQIIENNWQFIFKLIDWFKCFSKMLNFMKNELFASFWEHSLFHLACNHIFEFDHSYKNSFRLIEELYRIQISMRHLNREILRHDD